VDVLYHDFKKAFDSVPYARLLKRCMHMVLEEIFYMVKRLFEGT